MSEKDDYYLNLNLSYLKYLKKDVYNAKLSKNFKIISSKIGLPVLKNGEILYNSDTDPILECSDLFENVENKPDNFCIIFGLELGYLLKYFSENYKGYIILFENDLELIKYVFQCNNLIKYISKQNFSMVTNFDLLKKMLYEIKKDNKNAKINFVANKTYSEIYKQYLLESYKYE